LPSYLKLISYSSERIGRMALSQDGTSSLHPSGGLSKPPVL